MFIRNNQKKEIKIRSLEGYKFFIPTGVSAIWNKAGEHLLSIHKIEVVDPRPPKWIKGINEGGDGGARIPAIQEVTEKDWVKDGKKMVRVERFPINPNLIKADALIELASERGVEEKLITKWLARKNVEPSEITDVLNNMPIPEEIIYPIDLNKDDNTE